MISLHHPPQSATNSSALTICQLAAISRSGLRVTVIPRSLSSPCFLRPGEGLSREKAHPRVRAVLHRRLGRSAEPLPSASPRDQMIETGAATVIWRFSRGDESAGVLHAT